MTGLPGSVLSMEGLGAGRDAPGPPQKVHCMATCAGTRDMSALELCQSCFHFCLGALNTRLEGSACFWRGGFTNSSTGGCCLLEEALGFLKVSPRTPQLG